MQTTSKELAAVVVVSGVPNNLSYSLGTVDVPIGSEVTVEVGRRKTTGYVVEKIPVSDALKQVCEKQLEKSKAFKTPKNQLSLLENSITTVKPIRLKPLLSYAPAFSNDQIDLFRWIASYYGCRLIDVIENAVPKRVMSRGTSLVKLTETPLSELEELFSTLCKRAPVQAKIIQSLLSAKHSLPLSELSEPKKSLGSALRALKKKGVIQMSKASAFEQEAWRIANRLDQSPLLSNVEIPVKLTAGQISALEKINSAIESKTFSPILLFGVTGSGKTEVYLRAISHLLALGGSALVIVPEIALTPQLIDVFEHRLRIPIAVLHSQVGDSLRWKSWEAALNGDFRVVIGARSAVFAPLKNLSLIIVDEEHEQSYKQSDGLRYHARDIAVKRASMANCPVILGSATPSLESLQNVISKRYQVLELPERATAKPLPHIEIVNLNEIKRRDMPSESVSPQLFAAIKEVLESKGQVIILYNRRGFSSYLQCETCQEVVCCPNCSVSFTYHKGKNTLLCHYCNLSRRAPEHCAFCRDPKTSRLEMTDDKSESKVGQLKHLGGGTERVVDELSILFPKAKILRMDSDTVTTKGSYRGILGDMRSGEADILVGTQMIAKGHDLPGVTLVGIVDADVGLHLPDFRSSEKVFQLITQAAGRAGRGKDQGRVIIQTREPNHPAIVATVTSRFKAFARFELEQRKALRYPPFGKLLRLIISHTDRHKVFDCVSEITNLVSELGRQLIQENQNNSTNGVNNVHLSLLGPAPAALEKLRSRYRWHIIVKCSSANIVSRLAGELNNWRLKQKSDSQFRLAIDVDPYDML